MRHLVRVGVAAEGEVGVLAADDDHLVRLEVAYLVGQVAAEDELVGNIATESLIAYCQTEGIDPGLNQEVLADAGNLVPQIFLNHA